MKSSIKAVTRGENRERKEIVFVKLDEIVSDPDQPREYFYEERLKDNAERHKKEFCPPNWTAFNRAVGRRRVLINTNPYYWASDLVGEKYGA